MSATWGDETATWGDPLTSWDGADLLPDSAEIAEYLRARSAFVRIVEDRPFVRAQ